jgi:hypothetical protein
MRIPRLAEAPGQAFYISLENDESTVMAQCNIRLTQHSMVFEVSGAGADILPPLSQGAPSQTFDIDPRIPQHIDLRDIVNIRAVRTHGVLQPDTAREFLVTRNAIELLVKVEYTAGGLENGEGCWSCVYLCPAVEKSRLRSGYVEADDDGQMDAENNNGIKVQYARTFKLWWAETNYQWREDRIWRKHCGA